MDEYYSVINRKEEPVINDSEGGEVFHLIPGVPFMIRRQVCEMQYLQSLSANIYNISKKEKVADLAKNASSKYCDVDYVELANTIRSNYRIFKFDKNILDSRLLKLVFLNSNYESEVTATENCIKGIKSVISSASFTHLLVYREWEYESGTEIGYLFGPNSEFKIIREPWLSELIELQ